MDTNAGILKQMSLQEFYDFGFLQEINRLFLHPRGVALSMIRDDQGKVTGFGPVWDYRDDPEGLFFGDECDPEKAKRIYDLAESKREERIRRNGEVTQTIVIGEEVY